MLELTKQTEKICECVLGKGLYGEFIPNWMWLLKAEERVKIPVFLYFLYREAGNGVKDSIELTKEDIKQLSKTDVENRNWLLEEYLYTLRCNKGEFKEEEEIKLEQLFTKE